MTTQAAAQEQQTPTPAARPSMILADYRLYVDSLRPDKESVAVAVQIIGEPRAGLVMSLVDSFASPSMLMPHELAALGVVLLERAAQHARQGGNYMEQFARRIEAAHQDSANLVAQMGEHAIRTGQTTTGPEAQTVVDLLVERAEQDRIARERFRDLAGQASVADRPVVEPPQNPEPPAADLAQRLAAADPDTAKIADEQAAPANDGPAAGGNPRAVTC